MVRPKFLTKISVKISDQVAILCHVPAAVRERRSGKHRDEERIDRGGEARGRGPELKLQPLRHQH